ncbi:MAG: hypothetical protein B7C55_11705 [Actinomycetales bacterium mxb001]|nr:MAG: hypothetical protein B7C55_11705 [Actinomycetales bacterium mxb001]
MSRYRADGGRPLGQATVYPVDSITDAELMQSLETYRNAVATRYQAVSAGDITQRIGGSPFWVSPKLDGELWYLCRFDDETFLAAPNGRVISGRLDILEAAQSIPAGTVLAGELHVTPPSGIPKTVFVSSTSRDMQAQRAVLREVVEELGMTYIGMEDFVPDESTPADYIREQVDACDLYVGILGKRYGHVEPGSGMSMTEIEYHQAVAGSKPLRIFVMSDEAEVPEEFRDTDPEMVAKLQAFKERVLATHTCKFFSGLDDLRDGVRQALSTPSGRRGRVGDVGSALSGEIAAGPLGFAGFDVVTAGSVNALAPYAERLAVLRDHLPTEGVLRVVPTETADGLTQIGDTYELTVTQGGAEGIVVRASDGRTYKVKPNLDVDAVIVAFTERRNESGDLEVRSILVAVAHPDGGWVPFTAVGSLGSSANRQELHKRLAATLKPSAFRHATDNIMYRFVEPLTVVEIRVLDLQAEDTRGNPIRDARLDFDPVAGWRAVGQVDCVAALAPVLQRIRDDKLPTLLDAGWRQLEPYLSVLDSSASQASGPSEVLRREVWVKRASDKTDVRKLLVWKTNKEGTGKFPAYVVHWTDYSSTRKAPLAREVRLAPSEDEAMRIAEQMIASNVKKGWEPVT